MMSRIIQNEPDHRPTNPVVPPATPVVPPARTGVRGWVRDHRLVTFTITFVYVWLFNRTGGSVLLVLLFHSAQGFITMRDLGYSADGLARQQLLEGIAWAVVALALIVFDRSAWRRAPEAAIYHDDNP
jgi:hypothetical protein